MWPVLRLTEYEKRFNGPYAEGSRRAVLPRRYGYRAALSSGVPAATTTHQATRRSRIYAITWSGDVSGAKVSIRRADGEQVTIGPVHIPLLSGHTPHSTRSQFAGLPAYPTAPPPDYAIYAKPSWLYLIDPNIVVSGGAQLIIEYTLENPTDPAIVGGATFVLNHTLHVWEFPGFEGGAT